MVKGVVEIILLFAYGEALYKFQPFVSRELNKLALFGTTIQVITIYLGSILSVQRLNSDMEVFSVIFILIINIGNLLFFGMLLSIWMKYVQRQF